MYTNIDKDLLIKFLNRSYPVTRVKHNSRFKRAIVLDGGETFILSEENSYDRLRIRLTEIIMIIFGFDYITIKSILDGFLPSPRT